MSEVVSSNQVKMSLIMKGFAELSPMQMEDRHVVTIHSHAESRASYTLGSNWNF